LSQQIRGVRGATTVEVDQAEDIIDATEELVKEMIRLNQIDAEKIASVWMTLTEDLVSTFPAKALRRFEGWTYVPVMCSREIPVPDSLPKCIRVMINLQTELKQHEVQHVFRERAVQLRPDLSLTAKKT
jgi:chorismate mutase